MSLRIVALSVLACTNLVGCTAQSRHIDREDLRGAWTAGGPSFTFVIDDSTVLYEFDMQEHPYTLEGDVLVVDFGTDLGVQQKRIVRLTPDTLILRDSQSESSTTYWRME